MFDQWINHLAHNNLASEALETVLWLRAIQIQWNWITTYYAAFCAYKVSTGRSWKALCTTILWDTNRQKCYKEYIIQHWCGAWSSHLGFPTFWVGSPSSVRVPRKHPTLSSEILISEYKWSAPLLRHQRYILLFHSLWIYGLCKSLWTKASGKCPKCQLKKGISVSRGCRFVSPKSPVSQRIHPGCDYEVHLPRYYVPRNWFVV